jgi:general secretion pathway protein F
MALPNWFRGRLSASAQFWIDAQRLRIPIFGAMRMRRNVRDFLESLALMLEAGIPMLDALSLAIDTIDNDAIRQEFSSIRPRIEQGATLAQTISNLSCIRDYRIIEFIRAGEVSGTLPEMLFRYTTMETDSIHHFHQQIADWGPRLFYGLVMLWIAYGILSSR